MPAPVRIGQYEGLFLISQNAAGDFGAAVEHVKDILKRAEAETIVLQKWDERKLAYPIKGQKRGMYLIAIFKARAAQVANIDRDCNLSETIIRHLITDASHLGETEIKLAEQGVSAQAEARMRAAGDDKPRTAAPVELPSVPMVDALSEEV